MKMNILYIMFIGSLFSDTYTGYLREIEASFCMDLCSEYALEDENGVFIGNFTSLDEIDLSYYIDRFVNIESEYEYECLMCTAFTIQDISLSSDCDNPISCFVDPCEVADECQLNTPVNCISNFCDGCYSDFYDLQGNLVDCDMPIIINPCDDLSGLDFGMCDMYLGVAIIDGVCQHMSGCDWNLNDIDYSDAFFNTVTECELNCLDDSNTCEEIEYEYNQLHSDYYTQCEDYNDCIAVWGDCGVGLGGCHYAINESLYNQNSVNQLVSNWVDNDCMEWVCDCFDLPSSICSNGNCELAYCLEENPAGCFSTGCSDNYGCVDYSISSDCVPSSCFCDEFSGNWFCTEDCNGGSCFQLGDENYDSNINIVDVVLIVNSILGLSNPGQLSDVNSDNITNIIDVIILIDFILNGNR